MSKSIITVNQLTKKYDYYKKQAGMMASIKSLFKRQKLFVDAVKEINFNIEEGELIGFLGPNGAGKTTTLKMLSGILYPTSGAAKVLGHIPWKREKEYQKQFALVMGQKNQLWWDLPAMESFVLNKEIYEVDDKSFKNTLAELMEVLDIKDFVNIPVRKLSLGQRMKCELIAALLHKPKILFLDEPTIGLDVVSQQNIRDFLKKYNEENRTTIILTSHYMEDIESLCKRVIIIDTGKIMYDGNLDELIRSHIPYKNLTITFNNHGVLKKDVQEFGKIVQYNRYRVKFEVERGKAKDVAVKILTSKTLPVDDILIDEVSVDDVIRKVFRGGA
ncbi:ATP-binding cassette domain-containing protein [Patescibacteria group bacterium]